MVKKSHNQDHIQELGFLHEEIKNLTSKNQELTMRLEEKNKIEKAPEVFQRNVVKPEGITIQHVKPMRTWTILKSKVIKVHRGTEITDHERFKQNIILTPGCVVTVEPVTAKKLINTKDFQKYGVDR